jgi:GNAT superfamily N-acetyltransferase
MLAIHRPETPAELLERSAAFLPSLRFQLPDGLRHGRMWVSESAVAYATERPQGAWVYAFGAAPQVAGLVTQAWDELDERPTGVTMARPAAGHLPDRVKVTDFDPWNWRWTTEAPAAVQNEGRVEQLTDTTELKGFLKLYNPTSTVAPGDSRCRVWAGVRDTSSGDLLACGTYAGYYNVPVTPYLASIATATAARGQGLGAAVTAFLTRRALADTGVCTLGVGAGNTVAQRVYTRLGYRDDSHRVNARFVH